MKSVIFSFIALIAIFTTITMNCFFISRSVDDITNRLEAAPTHTDTYSVYYEIFEDYIKRQRFIGLTVSHEDLTNIECEFYEILGAIEAEDEESLIIAKSRLIGALSHLKRLSGINADSIF